MVKNYLGTCIWYTLAQGWFFFSRANGLKLYNDNIFKLCTHIVAKNEFCSFFKTCRRQSNVLRIGFGSLPSIVVLIYLQKKKHKEQNRFSCKCIISEHYGLPSLNPFNDKNPSLTVTRTTLWIVR